MPFSSPSGKRLTEAEWQRARVLFHSESCLSGGLLSARASKSSHQVSWPSCLYGRFGDFGQESLGLFFNSGSPHSATRQSKRRQHVLDSLVSQVLVRNRHKWSKYLWESLLLQAGFFVRPGPGASKGNLIGLPASKEADESKQGFFSFVSCSLVFLTDIQKESYSEVALAKKD